MRNGVWKRNYCFINLIKLLTFKMGDEEVLKLGMWQWESIERKELKR
jgi:hypothetical protein